MDDLGKAKKVTIDQDNTTIIEGEGTPQAIEGRVTQIRAQTEEATSGYDREQLQERLAKLVGGVALGTLLLSGLTTVPVLAGPVFRMFSKQMLFADPPYHTRLRSLVNKAFTPRMVAAMRSKIQRIADELLDAVQDHRRMDVMRDLAYPLPSTVIMEMLGLPVEERDQFKKWSEDFMAALGVARKPPEIIDAALKSVTEVTAYMVELQEQLVANPRNDLLSALDTVVEVDDELDDYEFLANAVLLLGAGHETTTKLIGNGLLALMRNNASVNSRSSAERPGTRPS